MSRRNLVASLAVVVVAAIATAVGAQSLVPSSSTAASAVEADGAVPAGTTAFDDAVPGVVKLDPALLAALRGAATDAAADGVVVLVDSGWRSAAYQGRLLDEAVAKYGSRGGGARGGGPPRFAPPGAG